MSCYSPKSDGCPDISSVGIGLSKFFDEVNHDLLINRIGRKIKNKALMRLLPDYVAIQLFTFT
ncbi:hypothetical protein [Motilimonas cestriensis]|uniref:hypothetical protein n=1 Tax=Motilimonas cestriensis TaxID=2742685 RepID=UPI003DA3E145